MIDWHQWFDQLLDHAWSKNTRHWELIMQYSFMYEDYYDQGATPEQAYAAEWGD